MIEELLRAADEAIEAQGVRYVDGHMDPRHVMIGTGEAFDLEPVVRAILTRLRDLPESIIARGEGMSDFILPSGTHDNTAEGRRRELRMAHEVMIDAIAEAGEIEG